METINWRIPDGIIAHRFQQYLAIQELCKQKNSPSIFKKGENIMLQLKIKIEANLRTGFHRCIGNIVLSRVDLGGAENAVSI
jgi:hypothetical protein